MSFFDWLHDEAKGKDAMRPKFIRALIIFVVIGIFSILWNYFF